MNILSKRLAFSVGLLGAVAMSGIVSQAHAQDAIQNLQQKEDQLHNRISQHNQDVQSNIQKQQDQMNKYKNLSSDQKQRFEQNKEKFKSDLDSRRQQEQDKINKYKNYPQEQKDRLKQRIDTQRQQSAERSAQQRKEWKSLKDSSKQNVHDLTHPFSNNR